MPRLTKSSLNDKRKRYIWQLPRLAIVFCETLVELSSISYDEVKKARKRLFLAHQFAVVLCLNTFRRKSIGFLLKKLY